MKIAAVLMLIVCLAALCGVGYLYMTASITVTPVETIASDAVSQSDYYQMLREQLENGSFVGTLYTQTHPDNPEEDVFYTYTVQITNHSFLHAEVIELQIMPVTGDILQIGDPEEHTLAPGRTATLSATLLTGKQLHNVRELTVTYYVWGLPFSARLTSQAQ